ncbi:uncharacterized protein LOC143296193 isoform X2 [Babylonia areolata]|uniref:uncharacterized protein LOC143296193 isoform X2 n=1 Tax=Babylonia areolata TaxID=304850 RepID=UPI003FCF526C
MASDEERFGNTQNEAASESLDFQADPGTVPQAVGTHSRNLNDLYEKFEDLAGRVTLLQSTNTLLAQNVTQLNDTNRRLSSEQSALQSEITTLKDQNIKLTADQAALQREMAALRDKNVIVHQDLAGLTAEKDKVSADLAKLHNDVVSMKTDVSMQQTDIIQLKADHGAVDSKLTTVQTDITALQACDAGIMGVNQLKTDCGELKSDMAKVQRSISDQQTDMTASKNQVVSLELKMQSVQDSLQDNTKALTALESRLATASTQVAFHARLSTALTTTRFQTLICDNVVSSVGGGYNPSTGQFTAPLAGHCWRVDVLTGCVCKGVSYYSCYFIYLFIFQLMNYRFFYVVYINFIPKTIVMHNYIHIYVLKPKDKFMFIIYRQ